MGGEFPNLFKERISRKKKTINIERFIFLGFEVKLKKGGEEHWEKYESTVPVVLKQSFE
jgi:hypothetical protein